MRVARVAVFEGPAELHEDDDRRAASLRELVRTSAGFVAGYHLRDASSGRLMSITVWESEADLERAEALVRDRPAQDQRGIEPTIVEQWVVEGTF